VRLLGTPLAHEYSLAELLKRPDVLFDDVAEVAAIARADVATSRAALHAEFGAALADAVIDQVQVTIKYAGYIDKQIRDVDRASDYENLKLPDELDYTQVLALSFEARQKLSKHRPQTLGQASRISGITPAAISLLLVHLKKRRFKGFATPPTPADTAIAH
jgi:tRNA uridine 5-carboxymethylaminomethyl modification enzyme